MVAPVKLKALSAKYDRLYDKADAVLKEHNPCQIRRDEDGIVRCADVRRKMQLKGYDYMKHQQTQLCCTACPHLGPNGCTVKALSCKLWLCSTLRDQEEHQPVVIALADLARDGFSLGIPISLYDGSSIRRSKEEVFGRMRRTSLPRKEARL